MPRPPLPLLWLVTLAAGGCVRRPEPAPDLAGELCRAAYGQAVSRAQLLTRQTGHAAPVRAMAEALVQGKAEYEAACVARATPALARCAALRPGSAEANACLERYVSPALERSYLEFCAQHGPAGDTREVCAQEARAVPEDGGDPPRHWEHGIPPFALPAARP